MKSRRRPYLTPSTSPSQPPSISTSPPQVAIKITCEVLYFSGMASSKVFSIVCMRLEKSQFRIRA
ncbi:unnamed protein product [Brassica oleracea var. botrytis]